MEGKTLDLVDVVGDRLRETGIPNVTTYLPDAHRHAEVCAISTASQLTPWPSSRISIITSLPACRAARTGTSTSPSTPRCA